MSNFTDRFRFWANLTVFCLPLLSACTVGPDYFRPKIVVPEKFKEAPKGWKKAEPKDAEDRGEWWKIFKDPQLNTLMKEVNLSNQNIAAAEAQYRQARALVDEARAAYFPTLTGNGSMTRLKSSSLGSSSNNSNNSGTTTSTTATTTPTGGGSTVPITNYSVSMVAAWEPDLWGAVRRAVEASKAGFEASAAQLAGTRLSMQALLAQSYFQLKNLDVNQKLLDDTVVNYQKSLDLAKNRYASGTVSRLDVIQAETQLQTAKALSLDNGIKRAQFEHAIAVLIGKPPALFALLKKPFKTLPPSIPLKLPSYLLERRPDIAAAERLMVEANAQIGVAMAAFYPTVTLSATGGYSSSQFSRWLTQPARFWSLGPQLTELIFDGGRRSAVKEAAVAVYDQSVATYRQTVLTAFQSVEDNLVALRILKSESVVQQEVVNNAKQALSIITNQYKAGTVDYSAVVTAEITLFNAMETAISINGQRMLASVGLITALGGGWSGLKECI